MSFPNHYSVLCLCPTESLVGPGSSKIFACVALTCHRCLQGSAQRLVRVSDVFRSFSVQFSQVNILYSNFSPTYKSCLTGLDWILMPRYDPFKQTSPLPASFKLTDWKCKSTSDTALIWCSLISWHVGLYIKFSDSVFSQRQKHFEALKVTSYVTPSGLISLWHGWGKNFASWTWINLQRDLKLDMFMN